MHGDLCGPIKPTPPSDMSLFPLPVDDGSWFMWLVLLGPKSEAMAAIKQVQARAEGKCDKRLRVLRTDQSGEFTSTSFQAYCNELGIQRHITTPYSPQQNGVVECRSQSVVGTA
jgi:transposase InsO family protein